MVQNVPLKYGGGGLEVKSREKGREKKNGTIGMALILNYSDSQLPGAMSIEQFFREI